MKKEDWLKISVPKAIRKIWLLADGFVEYAHELAGLLGCIAYLQKKY